MKKWIALLLVVIMCFSLIACGKKSVYPETSNTDHSANGEQDSAKENEIRYAEDAFSFEAVGYDAMPYAHMVNIDFKFRNITDENMDRVVFNAQGLDANGDVIETTVMGEENISAGQAAWYTYQTNSNRSCQTIDELCQKIHSIRVYSLQVHGDVQDLNTYYDLEFKEPIIIVLANVEDKEVASSQGIDSNPTDTTPPDSNAADNNTADVLVASNWVRKDSSGETIAVMTFSEDYTGLMKFSDGDRYPFTWSIGKDNTVDVVLSVDGRDAPGSYRLVNKNGTYSIQMVDNSNFTYYAD